MLKSRWLRILIKIILIFLLITVYFYFQHPVIYRYTDINAAIPIGDKQLIIDEINVHNLDEGNSRWKGGIPWRYRVVSDMNLPIELQTNIFKIMSFYSRVPRTEDYGTLQVWGILISPENIEYDAWTGDYFDISVKTGLIGGFSSGRSCSSVWENFFIVREKSKFDIKAIDKKLVLVVTDIESEKKTCIRLKPQWQKERLFIKGHWDRSPVDPVRDFVYNIYNDRPKEEVLDYVLPKLRNDFLFPEPKPELMDKEIQVATSLEWRDIYEDYPGVYCVQAEVGEDADDNAKEFSPQDILTFYVVKDHDAKYKIIHVRRTK